MIESALILHRSWHGDDSTQATTAMQHVKGIIDFIQLVMMSDVLVYSELILHVALDQIWNVHTGLEAAKRCSLPHTTCRKAMTSIRIACYKLPGA